jgi:hypothetical protein
MRCDVRVASSSSTPRAGSHEEANPYELDSKSIRRIVRSLEKEQICSIIHVRFAFLRLASDSPELLVQQQHL